MPAPATLYPNTFKNYLGLFAAALLGMAGKALLALPLALYFGARLLFPDHFALHLDEEGFSYRILIAERRYAWAEVERFYVRPVRLGPLVVARPVAFVHKGKEEILPEGYRKKPEALAKALNAYRARVVGEAPLLN